jgi:hypothetical protein
MPSPIQAVGRSPRHERHLPGFLCMGAVLYAGNTRTGSGPLGRGPGEYLKPFDGVTRVYVGDSLRTGSAQSV